MSSSLGFTYNIQSDVRDFHNNSDKYLVKIKIRFCLATEAEAADNAHHVLFTSRMNGIQQYSQL